MLANQEETTRFHDILLSKLRRGTLANRALTKLAPLELVWSRKYLKMPIDRPIFIVGAPRSGTSILYQILYQHPDLAHFTQASDLFPECPILANRFFRVTGLSQLRPTSIAFRGWAAHGYMFAEGYNTWRYFAKHNSVLEAHDVTHEQRSFYRQLLQKHLFLFRRSRFINKSPFNSLRLTYLNEIFPNALFIHIHRDGRAVARSTLEMRRKYGGPRFPFGPMPPKWSENEFKEPIVACGLQWKLILEYIDKAISSISPERVFTVSYEAFCEYPVETIRQVLLFCGLANRSEVITMAGNAQNRDYKWRGELTPTEIERLEAAIGDALIKWGYKTLDVKKSR
ncbi:MAG: sulfotransferase [Chloroflexota bacterium]|jgi:hypothetical protein